MTRVTAVMRKSGTFHMATWAEPEEWPYFASFEWEGQIFVVHRERGYPGTGWVVSHRDAGLRVAGSTARTYRRSIDKALEILAMKGRRRLMAAIRKAETREGR
jgi:hypothetical protein